MIFPWTCFSLSVASAKSNDITNIFVKSILVQECPETSPYDIIMVSEHFEIKNKELRDI